MADIKKYKYFHSNEWHEPISNKWFNSENPANGKVWATVPDCSKKDINIAVKSAKKAFPAISLPNANNKFASDERNFSFLNNSLK